MQHYYNTNNLDEDELELANYKNMRQESRVLNFFKRYFNKGFAVFQIHELLMPDSPYSSAQRSICNLTKEGHLIQTFHLIDGPWGKKVHLWKLADFDSNAVKRKPKRLELKIKNISNSSHSFVN